MTHERNKKIIDTILQEHGKGSDLLLELVGDIPGERKADIVAEYHAIATINANLALALGVSYTTSVPATLVAVRLLSDARAQVKANIGNGDTRENHPAAREMLRQCEAIADTIAPGLRTFAESMESAMEEMEAEQQAKRQAAGPDRPVGVETMAHQVLDEIFTEMANHNDQAVDCHNRAVDAYGDEYDEAIRDKLGHMGTVAGLIDMAYAMNETLIQIIEAEDQDQPAIAARYVDRAISMAGTKLQTLTGSADLPPQDADLSAAQFAATVQKMVVARLAEMIREKMPEDPGENPDG